MLVSFIIPSYNSAHTVKRCLDSIYALSLKQEEFEVIFIDDCSTDDTCEVVEQYAQQINDKMGGRIILLRQPQNNRQGAARNRGVSVANGEYICFVDSDDAVQPGIVEAIRQAHELQTDMTAFHTGSANEKGQMTDEAERLRFADNELFTGVQMWNRHPYWISAPWGYIYSKTFLHKADYPFAEGVLYEDSDFVAAHLYYAQRMSYSPALGYVAYYREGSTTHSVTHKNLSDYLLLGTRMLALYETMERDMSQPARTEEGLQQMAEGILEGACFNVVKSLRRLPKLDGLQEIRAFYDRVDAHIDRRALAADKRIHAYGWNVWTSIALNHRYCATAVAACLHPVYQLYCRWKRKCAGTKSK